MSTDNKKLKYPSPSKAALTAHEAKTEDFDTLIGELDFINHYLSSGHAKGRAHSKAALLNGKPGYFFVTSVDIGNGVRRDCIKFSTLVDNDVWLSDLD